VTHHRETPRWRGDSRDRTVRVYAGRGGPVLPDANHTRTGTAANDVMFAGEGDDVFSG